MKILVLLAIVACPLFPQAGLYIDLAGDWHYNSEDSPRMSEPEFDDSNWEPVRLPPQKQWNKKGWIRRSIELPQWADRSQLALTIGPIAAVYRVYVNGVEIGGPGSFESGSTMQIQRTRTFVIPADAANRCKPLHLAIRLGRQSGGGFRFRMDQQAPYLLTYVAQAPVSAGDDSLKIHRARFTPTLVVSGIYLAFCIPLLLAWFAERKRVELLWLVLFLIGTSVHGALGVLEIAAGSTPFNHYGVPVQPVLLLMLSWTLLCCFVLAATEWRSLWLYGSLWAVWLAASIRMAGLGGRWVFFGMGVISTAVTIAALTYYCWKLYRQSPPLSRLLFPAFLMLPMLQQLHRTTGAFTGRGGEDYFPFAGYEWTINELVTLVLTLVILILLVRQILQDRRDRQRLQGEMEAAREVQVTLLGQDAALQTGRFEVDPVYAPANEVGGDFHWTRMEPDGSLLLVVGDVSGKGLKAAMLVSVVIGMLRNERSSSPGAILRALNDGLVGHTSGGFVTCCCARFSADGTVVLANAGHLPPYADGCEADLEAGLPLGIAPHMSYQETTLYGTQFTFLSDGVVEAANERGELFGFDRTREISGQPAREIADAAKSWGQNDDITVVRIMRKPT